MTFHSTQSLGEIVAAFPGASNLFKAHGVDFCCGGRRTLAEALQQRQIPVEGFLAELQQAFAAQRQEPVGTDWREAPLGALVDHIVTAHHGYLKQELPLLSQFVRKIDQVHGERHPELATLDRLFHAFKAELESHMVAEEGEVFPRVRAYGQTGDRADLAQALANIDELETEHEAAGRLLAAMRETTQGYRLPEDACQTYALSLRKLADLESDMFEHVHLENNVLFPRLQGAAQGPQ